MKARVRNIPVGTEIEDNQHIDAFVDRMRKSIGKVIEVKPYQIDRLSSSGENAIFADNWFESDDGWNYHRSWLEFVSE